MATNKQKCHWRNPIPHHWESLFWRKVIWEAWPHLLLLLLFKKEDGGNKFYSSSFFSPLLNLIIWWWKATVHSDSTHMCVCFFCTVSTLLYKEKTGQCFSTLGVHIKITFSQKKKNIYIHTHTHTHTHTHIHTFILTPPDSLICSSDLYVYPVINTPIMINLSLTEGLKIR